MRAYSHRHVVIVTCAQISLPEAQQHVGWARCPGDLTVPHAQERARERERDLFAIPPAVHVYCKFEEPRLRLYITFCRIGGNRTLFTPRQKPHNKWGAHAAGELRTPPMPSRRRPFSSRNLQREQLGGLSMLHSCCCVVCCVLGESSQKGIS